ncbi:transcription termination factor MTERF15, mitochondrial-like [Pyrus communis]|uniref:transcription termination factor MTERF15, mitochondrial-like n=1 Tax=Pyrus communis TaxID=23211 RepID=UPI0035C120CE
MSKNTLQGYEENIAKNVDANGEKSTNSSRGNNDLEEEWDHKALADIEKNLDVRRVWDHDFLRPEPYSSKSLLVAEKVKLGDGGDFTVSYLINSCGLSPKHALSAAKKVHFDTPEGPNSVLNLLEDHGFDKTHISHLVKKHPHLLLFNPEKTLLPKLEFLGSIGLSGTGLAECSLEFKEIVKKIMSMGVSPSSEVFTRALHVNALRDASEWEQKMELYRKWGWTEDDFMLAFRRNPLFMGFTEKNFSSKMDFLVNKMGWQPADVAGSPTVVTYSLEKYIIPRCSVIRILLSKGLISKGEFTLGTFIMNPKSYFLNRFVIKYQEQVPELLSIF